ncbi:hypothetical protein HAX54_045044 [Datura stramonium]|uniref:Uncharacterized protein n=1 Tax=Datura stramonium TaxID=4076 RepID=A0ABS8WFE4_DATST|nr:hypothetical protein [Datura stramonium]
MATKRHRSVFMCSIYLTIEWNIEKGGGKRHDIGENNYLDWGVSKVHEGFSSRVPTKALSILMMRIKTSRRKDELASQMKSGVSVEVKGSLVENVTPSSKGVDEEDREQDIE